MCVIATVQAEVCSSSVSIVYVVGLLMSSNAMLHEDRWRTVTRN